MDIFSLQRAFKNELTQTGYSSLEANILCNKAFFAYYNKLGKNFTKLLFEPYDEIKYRNLIIDALGFDDSNIDRSNEYVSSFFCLKRYCMEMSISNLEINSDELIPERKLYDYCKHIKIHYSYKPLLLVCMLENCDSKGNLPLSIATNYFIEFFDSRRKKDLIVESSKSAFSSGNYNYTSTLNLILSNPVKVLEKDGIITCNDNKNISFVSSILKEVENYRQDLLILCNSILDNYFKRIESNSASNTQDEAYKLAAILSNMYNNANNGEKVTMIYLFGIKYAVTIKKDKIPIQSILQAANLPLSYAVEINKAIRLSKYVTAINTID